MRVVFLFSPCACTFVQAWSSDIWLWRVSGVHTSPADARILSGDTWCFPVVGIPPDWLVDWFVVGFEVKHSVSRGNIPEVIFPPGENTESLYRSQPSWEARVLAITTS